MPDWRMDSQCPGDHRAWCGKQGAILTWVNSFCKESDLKIPHAPGALQPAGYSGTHWQKNVCGGRQFHRVIRSAYDLARSDLIPSLVCGRAIDWCRCRRLSSGAEAIGSVTGPQMPSAGRQCTLPASSVCAGAPPGLVVPLHLRTGQRRPEAVMDATTKRQLGRALEADVKLGSSEDPWVAMRRGDEHGEEGAGRNPQAPELKVLSGDPQMTGTAGRTRMTSSTARAASAGSSASRAHWPDAPGRWPARRQAGCGWCPVRKHQRRHQDPELRIAQLSPDSSAAMSAEIKSGPGAARRAVSSHRHTRTGPAARPRCGPGARPRRS